MLAVLAAGTTAQAQPGLEQSQSSLLAAAVAAPAQPELLQLKAPAQDRGNDFVSFFRDAEWYFSFGSNKEFWAPTNIHVSQPSLGNNFTIYDVQGHDAPAGAGESPQYNIRLGRFVNDERTIAVELNFDHSKYYSNVGQTAQVSGLIGGVPVNSPYQLNNSFFIEQLHNGANHLMVDGVYRFPLIGRVNETFSVAGIAKAGVGVMLPHTTDIILGNTDDVGVKAFDNLFGLHSGWWQLNGWTAGVELGFRVVLFKPVYLELTDKLAYANLTDLPAYQGTVQQNLLMNEIVLTLGFTYDGPLR